MNFYSLAVRRRPNGWREGVRPAVRRWGGVLLLAILPCAGFAVRPWPDTRQRIVAFSDQLPNSLNATQRWFAATHFAGCQKMLRSEIQALRAYNTNFLCLHYQLAVGAGPANFIIGDAWGSDWTYVNAQSNWFLRNASTQRVHQTQWNWDLMDVRYTNGAAVSGFPAYWISNCLARLTNFDIYQAAGGRNRAVVRTFENVAVSGGLQIQGVASVDGAQFNGIEIESAGPAAPAIVVSSGAVTVPEGSTATFDVRLDTPPAGTVTVPVVRVSGDADIAVSGGASLVFTPANFAADQTVTLAAAEDVDTTAGTATIQCAAVGYTAASVTATEQDNDSPPYSAKINCGGGALAGGWLADSGFSGGSAKSTTSAIGNATNAPQAVYQTRRYAPTLTYSFPAVPDGTYTIRLHFAELYCNASGRRIFNVFIEGQTRLTNFDIYQAAGGKYRAVVRTFENVAVSGGLQIQGVASVDGAQFNGIEILASGGTRRAITTAKAATTVRRTPDTVLSSEDAQTPGAGWAAVDGDRETVWRAAGSWGSWICLGYAQPLAVQTVDVQFAKDSPQGLFTLASDDADNWFELEPELELGPVETIYLWFIFPAAPWAPPTAVREIELYEP